MCVFFILKSMLLCYVHTISCAIFLSNEQENYTYEISERCKRVNLWLKKKIPCTILQQAKTFKVRWEFSVFVLFEVCFVCHGQELSDIIVSEYISIYIFANVRGSNGMNFVHAIYVKLYLCIYDMIERDSLCL